MHSSNMRKKIKKYNNLRFGLGRCIKYIFGSVKFMNILYYIWIPNTNTKNKKTL